MCLRLSRLKYKNYISVVEHSLKNNIRSFWSFVKKLNTDHNIPSNTYLNNLSANNDTETTNLFSQYFGSVYCDNNVTNYNFPLDNSGDELVSTFNCVPEKLRDSISNMKDSVNCGPDGIPAYFVKRCWSALENPVVAVFNKLLLVGTFQILRNFLIFFQCTKTVINIIFQTIDRYQLLAVYQNYLISSLLFSKLAVQ